MIDVLRGFAALSVVVYHVIEHFKWQAFPISGPLVWFRTGWMGVDLFFVISGFVISLSAFSLINRYGETQFRVPFMKRRYLRIAPLHYATCLIYLGATVPAIVLSGGFALNALSHVGFFHNLSPKWAGAINGQNWSIGVEMQFYVLVAAVAPLLRTCRWWLIPAVAFPIAWTWRYGAFEAMPIDPQTGPYLRFWASTQLPGTLDQFAVGILVARYFVSEHRMSALRQALRGFWPTAAVASAAVTITLVWYWNYASFWDYPIMVVFWRTFAAISFASVVLATCMITSPWVIGITAPLRYLGTISYGIYLWHLCVILAVLKIEGLPREKALWLVIVLTLSLSAASWHFFEKRFVQLPRQ